MGQSIRIGDRWRRVSEVEARLRRARGETVRVDAPTPRPPEPLPVNVLADLPPRKPPEPTAPELTDEELERLTAPPPNTGEGATDGGNHLE